MFNSNFVFFQNQMSDKKIYTNLKKTNIYYHKYNYYNILL